MSDIDFRDYDIRNPTKKAELVKLIESISDEIDYIEPEHITKWLRNKIISNEQGALLLLMEQGMGKSTYSFHLENPKYGKENKLGESINFVRTIFLEQSQFSESYNFIAHLIDKCFGKDDDITIRAIFEKDGFKEITQNYKVDNNGNSIEKTSDDLKIDFIRFLKTLSEEYSKGENTRILLVFDGIDELRNPDAFFGSYVLLNNELPSSVYLLYTSRLIEANIEQQEMISKYSNKLQEFDRTAVYEVKRIPISEEHSSDNYEFLRTILDDKEIIEASEYRASNLQLFAKVKKYIDKKEQENADFSKPTLRKDNVVSLYIDFVLQSLYGNKFINPLKDILTILITAYEPLSFDELSYLSLNTGGSGELPYRFIGMMRDIRPLLRVVRSDINRYEIVNNEVKEDLRITLQTRINSCVKTMFTLFFETLRSNQKSVHDGESYLAANLYKLTQIIIPNPINSLLEESTFRRLENIAAIISEEKTTSKLIRAKKIYSCIIDIFTDFIFENTAILNYHLSFVYCNRGDRRFDLFDINGAISDYSQGIEIMENLYDNEELNDENSLARAYKARAIAYRRNAEFDKSIVDCDKSIKIWEQMRKESKQFIEKNLATAYMSNGNTYFLMSEYEKAIKEHNQCIEILERLYNKDNLSYGESLTTAYMNKIAVQDKISNNADRGIIDTSRCIDIFTDLCSKGILRNESYLGTAYITRGTLYVKEKDIKNAIKDYSQGIKIYEDLHYKDKLLDIDLLAKAYDRRGRVYFYNTNKHSKAINDFSSCIQIIEKLHSLKVLYDEKELADIYIYRGSSYSEIGKYSNSIKDWTQGIEIYERMCLKDELPLSINLASAYMNRGGVYVSITEFNSAIYDYSQCIRIWERLQKDGFFIDDDSLTNVYLVRGNLYNADDKYEKAIVDYTMCINTMHKQLRTGILHDESDLAMVINNRGSCYYSIGEYDKAIDDYNQSLIICLQLQEDDKLKDVNQLAVAYTSRSIIHTKMGNHLESINDQIDALRITQSLFSSRKELQEHYFSYIDSLIELVYAKNDETIEDNLESIRNEFLLPMLKKPKTKAAEIVMKEVWKKLNH